MIEENNIVCNKRGTSDSLLTGLFYFQVPKAAPRTKPGKKGREKGVFDIILFSF